MSVMFGDSKKERTRQVLRALAPYPAVFVPNQFGGWDVYFPNFPRAVVAGINFVLARLAAVEALNDQVYQAFRDGGAPPAPSDPDGLPVDEEEVTGARVVMLEPDRDEILRRLGLHMVRPRVAVGGRKYVPR
ncbi:MAG: hypothetical protein AB1896_10935 [Thermodesulfobacteriota bacterium]